MRIQSPSLPFDLDTLQNSVSQLMCRDILNRNDFLRVQQHPTKWGIVPPCFVIRRSVLLFRK
jgi:hypothetical protein